MTAGDRVRILAVCDLNSYANAYMRVEGFRALGCCVRGLASVPAGDPRLGTNDASAVEKAAQRLGFPFDRVGVQPRLLETVAAWKPDLLWIDKGNIIRPGTLARARRLSPQTILASFSPDDMFARHNRSWYYTWGLKYYDIVFTTKSYNAAPGELPALGARRVVFVDNYYDGRHYPIALGEDERRALGADVGFIGSFESERCRSLLFLAQHGVAVRVWGNGWEKQTALHPKLIVEGRPLVNNGADLPYTKSLCGTRINLNFLRKANRDRQTDRSVVIPACGAFMLAERTDEHQRLFTEGREAEYFASDEEMLAKTRYYLEHEAERAAIAAAARRRCLASRYSLADRLSLMLDEAMAQRPLRAAAPPASTATEPRRPATTDRQA